LATELKRPISRLDLISVVLPAHNEHEALPEVTQRVFAALDGWQVEVIVVDDGSGDGTWGTIESLHRADHRIQGLRLSRNFGHQSALLAGLRRARGAAVVMLDADGQHPPELIPSFLAHWQDGAEVVQGVREGNRHDRPLKRWASTAYYAVLRRLTGLPVETGSADFRLLSRVAVDHIVRLPGPPPFLRALIPWLGLRSASVPYQAERRLAGTTNYSWSRMLALSLEGVLGYSAAPLRLIGLVGVLLAGLAFTYLMYVVVVRVFSGHVVAGWASVAGLVALLGGIQLIVLGAMGEYLARVFIASLGRPHYVISEETGASE